MEPTELCLKCIARAGFASSRCEDCEDYGLFETRGLAENNFIAGKYRVSDLETLSARGRLAFILAALAEIQTEGEKDGS